MPEGIDQETLERACALLAEYHNDGLPEEIPPYTADAFKDYQIVPYEDWLIFVAPDGFTNQSFLVSDPMVYESPGWESYEDALTEARALKAAGATRRPEEPDDEDEDEDED
jgi:hypothetical protein